jgi:hypothetical protein
LAEQVIASFTPGQQQQFVIAYIKRKLDSAPHSLPACLLPAANQVYPLDLPTTISSAVQFTASASLRGRDWCYTCVDGSLVLHEHFVPVVTVSGAGKKKRATTPRHALPVQTDTVSHSLVECGKLDGAGVRRLAVYSAYFGKDIDIYQAANDLQGRVLYRASALAAKFGCATNKIGMYLSRRRNTVEGIFQASAVAFKPKGQSRVVKAGGYFASFQACKNCEAYFNAQHDSKQRKMAKAQKANAGVGARQTSLHPISGPQYPALSAPVECLPQSPPPYPISPPFLPSPSSGLFSSPPHFSPTPNHLTVASPL